MINPKTCDLCGLSSGRRPLTHIAPDGNTYEFCCMGCRQVFIMLLEMADGPDTAAFRQTELFRQCLEMGIIPRSEEEAASYRNYRVSDEPSYPYRMEDTPEKPPDENMLLLHLKISDMWCPACAWYIETVLSKMPGMASVNCQFSTDRLSLKYDPVRTSPKEIVNSISKLGYGAATPGENLLQKENRREFFRLILSALLTMNIMMLSFSLYSGFFITLSKDAAAKISWPIFIMATVVVFYGGRPIIRRAIVGFSSFAFGMESLVCSGVFSAYGYSVYQLFSSSIHLYFDTASMLITLVLLGKMLERKAKEKITDTLDIFLSLIPEKVRLLNDLYPKGRYIPISQLEKGGVYGLTTGEISPADGTILEGNGQVDESMLTGEARNVKKKFGDRFISGSRVVDGTFRVRADAVGGDALLGQMTGIMETAIARKTPLEGPTEKILQWFVPCILFLSFGTWIYCMAAGHSTEEAIMRAITVMVISCPCALGIAIPLARVAAVSIAAKMGILVRNFSVFEKAPEIDTIVLDKTGTVTKGEWDLLDVVCFGEMTRKRALLLAAALEKKSDHTIAGAIRKNAAIFEEDEIDIEPVGHYDQGVSGVVDGKEIRLGSSRFVESDGSKNDPDIFNSPFFDDALSSTVYMRIGNEMTAVFIFGDEIKTGVVSGVQKLKKIGHSVILISGDAVDITRKVAEKLGIETFYGEKTPVEKSHLIRELQKAGHVVGMVGDGINDAPAMAVADLAVGIHGKYSLAKETADITLMRGTPDQLLDFFRFSNRVRKKIRQNFRFSFLYNMISIPIAMAGLLNPIIAVFAMLASSLSVIGNTLVLVGSAQRDADKPCARIKRNVGRPTET